MPEPLDPDRPANPAKDAGGPPDRPERRRRRVVGSERNPRVAAAQFVARYRLEPFHRALSGLAVAVFGADATVVAHLRADGRKQRLTFVVDAADPQAGLDYAQFLPREHAFWTAYTQLAKPAVPFAVAIRPARGWCRTEALAPFFAYLPTRDAVM
ncbi:hypothetical protein tb265_29340 [Gemmatimonadetes bacterium T265]|nr:hypothetical protein tb265_29340 [Gemmatimonadetes bacterium T265]